jgi:hypothetical protein
MKIIKDSDATEAVLEWLKAELNSERFSGDLKAAIKSSGHTEEIITAANLDEADDNKARWQILKTYRDWLDKDFNDYDWQYVELNQEEVGNLQYIDYSYWNELSDNTRQVKRAAANVANGKIVYDVPNTNFLSVAKAVETGKVLPPIIILADSNESLIIEGHLRATGYMLAERAKSPLQAIWGTYIVRD